MGRYYWCLSHARVEEGQNCRAADRLGPYDSPEAARDYRDRVERRNEDWKAEDERWDDGDGPDNPGPDHAGT